MTDRKQIAVRISDGLGNQMFQYAFAYALSKTVDREVLIDPFFWKRGLRHYQLDQYNISMNKRLISPMHDYILGVGPLGIPHLKTKQRERLCAKKWKLLEDDAVSSLSDIADMNEQRIYAKGYWQKAAFFDRYYRELKKELSPAFQLSDKAKTYQTQMQNTNSVSLHIRRTDYVRSVDNVCLDWTFYKEALRRMQEVVGEFELFIFTDDKEYVRDNFKLHAYVLIEDCTDFEDMELMHACKHHIVANSSFSFWGAYLGDDRNGTVVAPLVGDWKKDYYLDTWHCIETSFS